ncbi:MAG: hypothetical protein U0235_03115 [Polyangiaceae bacterium]
MRLLMLPAAAALFACACGKTTEAPAPPGSVATFASAAPAAPAKAQTRTVTLVVSDGSTRLGTFVLEPGKPGVLTLETQTGRAAALKAECDAINATERVSVTVDSRPRPGVYENETHVARRGEEGYPSMVATKLISEGFKVAQ